ncbi:MAG: hypothetical protein JWQ49_272 [Edaphobacter sp.]|nr:hypothetical protein [Edaphobacter sp.]
MVQPFYSRGWIEALWDRYFTGAPRRQSRSVERYNISEESLRALARRHGINAKTVANWFRTLSICKIYRERREGYFLILVSLVLGISFLVLPTYAQSAAKWSKIGLAAEAREDYDAAFEAYRHAHQEKVGICAIRLPLSECVFTRQLHMWTVAAYYDRAEI